MRNQVLADGSRAYVSRYALGRDYHKVVRQRLQQLATRIGSRVGEYGYRVFTDSAPVLEVELAQRSGIGWRGRYPAAVARGRVVVLPWRDLTPTCACLRIARQRRIAAVVMPASMPARPEQSSRPIASTHGAVFPT